MEKISQQATYSGKRIVIYGPESTGKSTLSQKLAQHFNTAHIEEFARDYLQDKYDQTGKACEYHDILPIVEGQRKLENKAIEKATDFLFCDTDVLETYVYSMAYFDKAPAKLVDIIENSSYDLYLLLQIDVPWTADDLRDRPEQREEMFGLFLKALQKFEKPYKIIDGLGEQRFYNALKAIEEF